MLIKLNPESGVPYYLQIVRGIKYLVAAGALKAGDKVPPVRDLAIQLRINPNTIAHAYRELQHDGILDGRWGEGNFISADVAKVSEHERERIVAELLEEAIHQAENVGLHEEPLKRIFSELLKKRKEKK